MPSRYGSGGGDVEEAGREGLVAEAAQGLAGRGHRAERRAVVGAVAGDDLEAVRLPAQLVVLADELEGQLVGLGAGVRVVGGAVAAEQPVEPFPELDRGDVPARQRVEGELGELRRGRVGEPLAAVSDVDAPLAAQAVQVAVSVDVRDPGAVALLDDDRPGPGGRPPAHLVPDRAVPRAPVAHPVTLSRVPLDVNRGGLWQGGGRWPPVTAAAPTCGASSSGRPLRCVPGSWSWTPERGARSTAACSPMPATRPPTSWR